VFSPDGGWISFSDGCSPGCADNEVYTANLDGSSLRRLTNNGSFDGFPDRQPVPGPKRSDYKNGAKFCEAEREFLGEEAFRQKYGGRANAYGKCVSGN
jgi:hypothetical protein